MGSAKYPRMLWWLAIAFAVVSLAFMAATLAVGRDTKAIELDARSLQSNALPSVERLTAARTLLRRIDASAARLSVEPAPEVLDEVKTARDDLDDELGEYRTLRGYPGERELYAATVEPGVQRLVAAEDHLAALDGGPGHRDARRDTYRDLNAGVESADQGLRSVIDLNAVEARELATHIIASRQGSVLLAAALDGVAAIVALFAAAIAIAAAQRYARQRERDAEQLRARVHELDLVALRVAHDVLSPLSAVGLSLAALGRQHGDEVSRRTIARAQRSLIRSRDVASGIYDFARSGAVPVRGARAPLRPTIDAVVEDLLEGEADRGAQIVVEPFEDCDVACETGVLYSMLCNVLSNALKFSRESAERLITVHVRVEAGRVRVEVGDTGPGIPAGLESVIFEPYFRAPGVAQAGLGLGLATVKRYAVAHGGAVGARRKNTGSVVWFELPRAPGPVSSRAERRPSPAPPPTPESPAPLH